MLLTQFEQFFHLSAWLLIAGRLSITLIRRHNCWMPGQQTTLRYVSWSTVSSQLGCFERPASSWV